MATRKNAGQPCVHQGTLAKADINQTGGQKYLLLHQTSIFSVVEEEVVHQFKTSSL